MSMSKISILSQTHDSFADLALQRLGKGHIHAGLLYEEFFKNGKMTGSFPAFNNAKNLLEDITAITDISMPSLLNERNDGMTGKFLLKTHDNLEIESVLIPMQSGGTLCVSSQVGCRMGCTFCETGRMGLLRNLEVSEIISQIFIARHILKFSFKNVVFMGMGEPFDNYDNVIQAAKILNDQKGLAFGRRQVTISTSGCIEGIERLIKEGEYAPNLAVSINAPDDVVRNKLMPVNRKHNMAQLYDAMKKYCDETGRQILTAYVLMKGINDSLEHADKLADYLQGLEVKVNLIPYNAQSKDRFAPPDNEIIFAFSKRLRENGLYTLMRVTKGDKIMAACGQLGNLNLRKEVRNQKTEARSQKPEVRSQKPEVRIRNTEYRISPEI